MDRLSVLDAEFLHLEDGIAHLHIAGVSVFEGPPPPADRVEQLLGAKLAPHPALSPACSFRRRSSSAGPCGLTIRTSISSYHVRRTALPGTGRRCRTLRAHGAPHVATARPSSSALGDVGRRGPRRRPMGAHLQGPPLHGRRHLGRRSRSPCSSTSSETPTSPSSNHGRRRRPPSGLAVVLDAWGGPRVRPRRRGAAVAVGRQTLGEHVARRARHRRRTRRLRTPSGRDAAALASRARSGRTASGPTHRLRSTTCARSEQRSTER